jgi:hypothetical protein
MIAMICGVWSDWPGDDPQAISAVAAVVDSFARANARPAQGKISAEAFLDSPSWNDVETASYRLRYPNRDIARAKALVVLDKHPEPYSD